MVLAEGIWPNLWVPGLKRNPTAGPWEAHPLPPAQQTGTEATLTPILTPAPRFFIESARWHSSSGRLDLTLKTLQRVAWINGKREEGTKLSMEVRPPPHKTSCDTLPGFHPQTPNSGPRGLP